MTETLECIIAEPSKPADSCVIWLHGLGADGHDFEGVLPELDLPESHRIRFIFPHAPMRPITINQHMTMRGWFDIYSLNSLEQVDEKGIEASRQQVEQLIQIYRTLFGNVIYATYGRNYWLIHLFAFSAK